jgi:ribosome-binding protein aMBF1 (putative translation factor)
MSRFAEQIQKLVANSKKAQTLSNSELAQELLDKVWSHYSIASIESGLLDEAIKRLREMETKG